MKKKKLRYKQLSSISDYIITKVMTNDGPKCGVRKLKSKKVKLFEKVELHGDADVLFNEDGFAIHSKGWLGVWYSETKAERKKRRAKKRRRNKRDKADAAYARAISKW